MKLISVIKNKFCFKSNKENRHSQKSVERALVVSVPDIKEYLVKEYNRVNDLKLINEGLEQRLEQAKETELKYKATLVTLDEYSRRLERAETEVKNGKLYAQNLNQEIKKLNDEINSYRIKFNNAAITKEELTEEIVEETKQGIILMLSNVKGNLSKKSACEMIDTYYKENAAR